MSSSQKLIADRYAPVELVGRGGYGEVYRALHVPMHREVALKLLRSEQRDAASRARFEREARVVQALTHPNTVRVFDFGYDADGTPFIAYELLQGESLAALIKREGALSSQRTQRIGGQILKALIEAHEHGVVHRDLKPGNVFICQFPGEPDFVKVIDFGIAKSLRPETQFVTSDGSLVGTPAYMAPEHLRGDIVTPACDLYAGGLIIAEMLTGRRVYSGDPTQVALAQLSVDPVPLPEIVRTSPFGPFLARATEKDPLARPRSAAAMLADLEQIGLGNTAQLAVPTHVEAHLSQPQLQPQPQPQPSRVPWIAAVVLLGGVVVAGLIAAAVIFAFVLRPSSAPFTGAAPTLTPSPMPSLDSPAARPVGTAYPTKLSHPERATLDEILSEMDRVARLHDASASLEQFYAKNVVGEVPSQAQIASYDTIVFASYQNSKKVAFGIFWLGDTLDVRSTFWTDYPTLDLPKCRAHDALQVARRQGAPTGKSLSIQLVNRGLAPKVWPSWRVEDDSNDKEYVVDARNCAPAR